jgi:hypothetical protein
MGHKIPTLKVSAALTEPAPTRKNKKMGINITVGKYFLIFASFIS